MRNYWSSSANTRKLTRRTVVRQVWQRYTRQEQERKKGIHAHSRSRCQTRGRQKGTGDSAQVTVVTYMYTYTRVRRRRWLWARMKTPGGAPRECSRRRIGRSHECTPRAARRWRAGGGWQREAEPRRVGSAGSLTCWVRRVGGGVDDDDDDDEQSPRIAGEDDVVARGVTFAVPFPRGWTGPAEQHPVARRGASARKGRGGRGNRHRGVEYTRRVDTQGGGAVVGSVYTRCSHVWPTRAPQCDDSTIGGRRNNARRVCTSGGMHRSITLLIIKEYERAWKELSGKGGAAIFEYQRENFRRRADRAQLSASVCPSWYERPRVIS